MRFLAPVPFALALVLAGCPDKGGGPSAPPTSKKPVVGVTLLTETDSFYQELEAGMKAEAEKQGLELVIVSAEYDAANQNSQIENFVTRKVAAIICCPVESTALGAALRRASESGIPIFTADIRAKDAPVVCHVASANEQGGRLLGEFLVKKLGGKGKVAIIDHAGITSVGERVAGFESALKGSGLEIVEKQSAEGQRQRAQEITDNLLKKYPDLSAIFGINDNCALGALRAVETGGRKDVVIVGYDASPEAREAISRGSQLLADAAQNPREIGSTVVSCVARHAKGEKVDPEILVKLGLATRDSLAAEKK